MAGRLDAIVVAYQRTQFLPRLLPELRKAVLSEGGRLIVVDNGSDAPMSDEIANLARESDAMLIRLEKNANHGEALNRAMLESSADAILLAHSDTVPGEGCVEAMLSEIGRYDAVMPYTNSSHIVGAVVPLSDGRPYQSLKTPATRSRTVASALAVDVMSSAKTPTESREVDGVDTCFMVVRRDVAAALGGFNEKVFHRDARMDILWWSRDGSDRFTAAAAAGAFCFHYGGFTLDEVFQSSEVPVRTNDLILSDGGKSACAEGGSEDEMRNCVLRFDAEVCRVAPAPVFGQPIHLLHIGPAEACGVERGIFESCATLAPEDSEDRYNDAVLGCESPWIMVLRAGECLHESALAGIKRLTNEPYDAVEFPFMLCSTDRQRCLLSRADERYPFGRVRLFRKDSGCTVLPGGEVTVPESAAVRRCARLPGDSVLQQVFRFGEWSGKWLDMAPQNLPGTSGAAPLPTVVIPATGDRLSVAVAVATLDVRKPVHCPSRMASFGLRDALAGHPNVLSVDCYDGEWFGKVASNDRVHAIQEGHHVFLSVDEMRPAPDIPECARVCWLTTARFGDGDPISPAHVASLGYEKYFVASRRFRDEMRRLGCDCDFLPPSVSGSRRKFAKISTRCQVGMLLRALPRDWDADGVLDVLSRLRDTDCRVFGHGWGDTGRIRRDIADMPRTDRAKLVALLDELAPLVGKPIAAGQESVMFSSMRCFVHVPSVQDGEWGFMPHSVCEALAAGTPVVLLDRNGQFSSRDFDEAPVYLERTASAAAQRAVDIAALPFDDLLILSERAKGWAASNTHSHRAASVLASLTVHPAERSSEARGSLVVRGHQFSERLMDRIRFQAKLRGMEEVLFEEIQEMTDTFSVEFEIGGSMLSARWSSMPSASQVDGVISAL